MSDMGYEAVRAALLALMPPGAMPSTVDVTDVGVSAAWLIFGFAAQGIFMARFIVQWMASERAGRSVVPTSFWIISLLGGISLCIYFIRRGDPVGVAGQSLGLFIYLRNLIFIKREKEETKRLTALEAKPASPTSPAAATDASAPQPAEAAETPAAN